MAGEFSQLVSRARHTVRIGLSDENTAIQIVSELAGLSHWQAEVELYIRFDNWKGPGQFRELEKLLAKGVQVFWNPEVERSGTMIDGVHYSLEADGARAVESRSSKFRKAGFFGVLLGELAGGQRLAGGRGFPTLIIVEQRGMRYPVFVGRDRLPSDLSVGDVLRVAYLSMVGDRTLSGSSPPTEVFLEALFIEQIGRRRNNKPLLWSSAKDVIDDLLAEFVVFPLKSEKKEEAWMGATRAKILSNLRKRMVYIDADDERYLYAKIREKVRSDAK